MLKKMEVVEMEMVNGGGPLEYAACTVVGVAAGGFFGAVFGAVGSFVANGGHIQASDVAKAAAANAAKNLVKSVVVCAPALAIPLP